MKNPQISRIFLCLLYIVDKILYYFYVKKKIFISLTCFGLLAIGIVILLVFFAFRDGKDLSLKTNDNLTNYTDDISLSVGSKVYDYYELSDKTAELSFELDKYGIIYIDETMIEGLSAGVVNVVMTAKTKNATTKTEFVVRVYENENTIDFIALSNCSFEGDTIIITDNVFQFKIEVRDKLNNKVENVNYNITSNKPSTEIYKEFSSIMIVTNENCILTFIFPDLSVTFSKKVIMQ